MTLAQFAGSAPPWHMGKMPEGLPDQEKCRKGLPEGFEMPARAGRNVLRILPEEKKGEFSRKGHCRKETNSPSTNQIRDK